MIGCVPFHIVSSPGSFPGLFFIDRLLPAKRRERTARWNVSAVMFLDTEATLLVRQILLLMLCRNERKKGILKQGDGWLIVEPVPEDIAKDQVLVVWTKCLDEEVLEPMTFEGFVFVGREILF